MNVVILRYKKLDKALSHYLADLADNPPFGMGNVLKPLNQFFEIIQILGYQMQAQDKRIADLESRLEKLEAAADE